MCCSGVYMEQDIIISIKNLSKAYKLYNSPKDRLKEALFPFLKPRHTDYYALNNVSLNIKKGETIGIIGKNGSGKSTLLKIITGVLTPTSGEVKVNGKIAALLELGAGFNPEMTGIENVYMNGIIMGYTEEEMDKRIDKIIEFADIGEYVYQPVKMYSSGMFARLAFAVAINVEPDILIVDEALSVGDMRFQIKCMDHMKKMMDSGTTVLFVTHDINAVRRFCSRAVWINEGSFTKEGDVNMVADAYLDYLKLGEFAFEENVEQNEHTDSDKDLPAFVHSDTIADIVGFHIYNQHGSLTNDIMYDEPVTIEVIYDVFDENIESPVLGIALRSIDHDYICGINTLLDKVEIPWKYGRNRFHVKFIHGILATGGKYYFDAALFDKTATVSFPYKAMVSFVTVSSSYVGEGRYIIPHKWS